MAALAAALSHGAPRLHELSLQWNHVADDGAAALARAITGGALANLQYLYLDNNQIGDDVRRLALPPPLAPPCQRHGRAMRR